MAPLQVALDCGSTTTAVEQCRTNGLRHDSPLEDGDLLNSSTHKHNSIRRKQPPKMNSAAFRFVVVDHPDQLRDRQEMRENRMHVMHDYLNKERRRPDTTDARVSSATPKDKKRKPLQTSSANRQRLHSSPPDEQIRSSRSGSSQPSRDTESPDEMDSERRSAAKQTYQPKVNGQRLVTGIGGRFEHSDYMRMNLEDIPPSPGSHLEPFGSWPAFDDPSLDVKALKFSCSQRFGSAEISQYWIPTLLRARHAFLSTLCISSSHDAIMTRALVPSHVQSQYKAVTRWKVKREVISMVARCMSDPKMQAADETILAVLHLLNSDIMGCDDRDMRIHQEGLNKMIQQRGGLECLGLGGQLSAILTITNYLIAALREMSPHQDYIKFASKQNTKIPADDQDLPENPIYCRPSGFRTMNNTLSPDSKTYELLDTLRTLTNVFGTEKGACSAHLPSPFRTNQSFGAPTETVSSLHQKMLLFKPCQEEDFDDMNERYTYESIRLTALVYTSAFSKKLPFSEAAAELYRKDGMSASIPIQLKHALMRTDTSFCWDHLGGVLFWITLIGGAAANPGPFADEERVGDAEDARKFLAALAVRCCIVLGFQYGPAVLETLKRLVTIESALARTDKNSEETVRDDTCSSGPLSAEQDGVAGPAEASHLQLGFADFAEDFLSA